MKDDMFNNLFVLELARNHWGSVERGKKIIQAYAKVIKENNVKAAIKLQAFDTDTFIHKDFIPTEEEMNDDENSQAPGTHTRYIKKTLATRLLKEEFKELVDEIKSHGLYTMVTPYDEASVDLCEELDVDMMKLASSDTGAITLLEKVINLGKPLSISTGAVNLEHVDRVVRMAEKKKIPLAINQCISNYPSEDEDLQLNQIDFWMNRYPNHIIGFSSHDYHNITFSHIAAYTKGARTFERHVDIDLGDKTVSKYCIVPEQADQWFKAHHAVVKMISGSSTEVRDKTEIEKGYLSSVNRGVYALRDLPKGYAFDHKGLGKDFYLAIPLQGGQIPSRDINTEMTLTKDVKKDSLIATSDVTRK